ncbi:hypothetical protein [Paraburkholderia fungorum]|uniref:hypothetical protein n=1 Tax=Paraburkholderia fungorum TaxID=134537 RepID=UPI0030B964E7
MNAMTDKTQTIGEMTEEQSFQLLVAGVRDYAIFMLDPDGFVRMERGGATLQGLCRE